MTKIRRVDFYPDDWLAGTGELDDAERGVYITICALIYSRGGPISIELAKSFSRSHGHMFTRCVQRLQMTGKVSVNDGQIDSKRCANELQRSVKRLEKARENGAKGGRPNGLAKPDGFLSKKTNNLQSTINIQHTTERNARESRSSNEAFDRWWEGYPEKVGKGAAKKAFTKALTKTSLDQLTTGVARYKANKPVDRAWCNPATWLNQERWNDAPSTSGNGLLPFTRAISDAEIEDTKRRLRQSLAGRDNLEPGV
jgi:uncharacterized protein YdaU (DUF1376 family)